MNLIPYRPFLNDEEQHHILTALKDKNRNYHEGNYWFTDVDLAIQALDVYYGKYLNFPDMKYKKEIWFHARHKLVQGPEELQRLRNKRAIFEVARWGTFVFFMFIVIYWFFIS